MTPDNCLPDNQRETDYRQMLERVANELDDPMGARWCDNEQADRELLRALLTDVLAVLEGDEDYLQDNQREMDDNTAWSIDHNPHDIRRYKMSVYFDPDANDWVADVPDLPGCIGAGDSPAKAVYAVMAFIPDWISLAKERGETVKARDDYAPLENCLTREEMDHPVRAVIHFNLDDPEGERRLRECLDAPKWKSAVWEFDQWARNRIKYNPDSETDPLYISEEGIAWLGIAREQLNMRLEDYGINIWEE